MYLYQIFLDVSFLYDKDVTTVTAALCSDQDLYH